MQNGELGGLLDWAQELIGMKSDEHKIDPNAPQPPDDTSKVEEFSAAVSDLKDTQKKVDDLLDTMPDGPEKSRLLLQREESRTVFQTYIMPAWEKIKSMLGWGEDTTMGFLPAIPLIAWGAIAAATAVAAAAIYYIHSNIDAENAILNDPALKAWEKERLLQARGSISGALNATSSTVKWVAIGVGAVVLLMMAQTASKHVRR